MFKKKTWRRKKRSGKKKFLKKYRRRASHRIHQEVKTSICFEAANQPVLNTSAIGEPWGIVTDCWPVHTTQHQGVIGSSLFIKKLVINLVFVNSPTNGQNWVRILVVKSKKPLIGLGGYQGLLNGNATSDISFPDLYQNYDFGPFVNLKSGLGKTVYAKNIFLPEPPSSESSWTLAPSRIYKPKKIVVRVNKEYKYRNSDLNGTLSGTFYYLFVINPHLNDRWGTGCYYNVNYRFSFTDS